MSTTKDMAGSSFGLLTVISRSGSNSGGDALWLCQCLCGGERICRGSYLRNGKIKHCGCLGKKECHGHAVKGSETSTYQSWQHMRQRCKNPDNDAFKNYGARGISASHDWESFEKFLFDMGTRPKGTTLDRIDNNKGYSKDNCRWVDKKSQQRNRRVNHVIKTKLGEMCIAEAAEIYGINQSVAGARIRRGWDIEQALTSPVQKRNERVEI